MKHFIHLLSGIDVNPLKVALQLHPELWNMHNQRKEFEGSSHVGTSDIWVRYNDLKNLVDDYEKFTQEHDSVWHDAYYKLPQLRSIIFGVMAACQASRLGGVLITKIPSGGHVLPHTDLGWHPEYYNMKVYVPIQTNDRVINRVEDEAVVMKEGDAWYFDNTKEHEVMNQGTGERMTLIICMRCD
jgi:hypothetical protein